MKNVKLIEIQPINSLWRSGSTGENKYVDRE